MWRWVKTFVFPFFNKQKTFHYKYNIRNDYEDKRFPFYFVQMGNHECLVWITKTDSWRMWLLWICDKKNQQHFTVMLLYYTYLTVIAVCAVLVVDTTNELWTFICFLLFSLHLSCAKLKYFLQFIVYSMYGKSNHFLIR